MVIENVFADLLDSPNEAHIKENGGSNVPDVVLYLVLQFFANVAEQGAENVNLVRRELLCALALLVAVCLPHFLQMRSGLDLEGVGTRKG